MARLVGGCPPAILSREDRECPAEDGGDSDVPIHYTSQSVRKLLVRDSSIIKKEIDC